MAPAAVAATHDPPGHLILSKVQPMRPLLPLEAPPHRRDALHAGGDLLSRLVQVPVRTGAVLVIQPASPGEDPSRLVEAAAQTMEPASLELYCLLDDRPVDDQGSLLGDRIVVPLSPGLGNLGLTVDIV